MTHFGVFLLPTIERPAADLTAVSLPAMSPLRAILHACFRHEHASAKTGYESFLLFPQLIGFAQVSC